MYQKVNKFSYKVRKFKALLQMQMSVVFIDRAKEEKALFYIFVVKKVVSSVTNTEIDNNDKNRWRAKIRKVLL